MIALISSITVILLGPSYVIGDTESYYSAKEKILTGSFDHLRTPLYPVFLLITYNWRITTFFQYLIFFVSIFYLYRTFKIIKTSPRLIFIAMVIYVCHPAFMYYQNLGGTEALCISLSSIFIYHLVTYIRNEKILNCWIFHIIILFLILLKPGCVFLLSIPVILLIYLFFTKRKLIVSYTLPFLLVLLFIGGYGLCIKKTYDIYSISSVSDINLYWMLRERNKINVDSIKNNDVKNFVSDKVDVKYENYAEYYAEADSIINQYGWKELHSIVQSSLKNNHIPVLFDNSNIRKMQKNMYDPLGKSVFFCDSQSIFSKFDNYFFFLTFYQLILVLFFYFFLIIKHIYIVRKIPIISVLFFSCVSVHLFSLILTAPNDYGRLIIPSLLVILIICMQCLEWFVLFIQKKEKNFILL